MTQIGTIMYLSNPSGFGILICLFLLGFLKKIFFRTFVPLYDLFSSLRRQPKRYTYVGTEKEELD